MSKGEAVGKKDTCIKGKAECVKPPHKRLARQRK